MATTQTTTNTTTAATAANAATAATLTKRKKRVRYERMLNNIKQTLGRVTAEQMRNFDKEAAIEYCKGMINDLLSNRVDLSLLVITKGLTKKLEA